MGTSKNATPQPDFGGPDSAWHGHADPNLTYAVELVKDMGLNKALGMGFQKLCMRCLCKNHQKTLVKASWRVSCKGMIIIILIHPSINSNKWKVNFVPFGAGGQQGGHREAHSVLRCRGRRRCGSQHDLRCPVLRVTQRLLGHDCGQRTSHPTVHLKQRGPLGLADKPRELVLYQESKKVVKIDGSMYENVMAEVISNELWPLVLLNYLAAEILWHKKTRVATRPKSFLRSWGSRRDWKDAPDPCQHLQPWILWPKRFLWPKWLKMALK